MKNKYFYVCVLEETIDGYGVYFPDFSGCISGGETIEEAIKNAKEALLLHMYGMQEDSEEFPIATSPKEIVLDKNEVAMLLDVDYELYRAAMNRRSTKCTLTLPQGLYVLAKANNINMSQVLQEALKSRLEN